MTPKRFFSAHGRQNSLLAVLSDDCFLISAEALQVSLTTLSLVLFDSSVLLDKFVHVLMLPRTGLIPATKRSS
jgi:hypothetical protein